MRGRGVIRAGVMLALVAAPAAAQRTHALIITGLGGEAGYTKAFAEQGAALRELARTQWHVPESSLVWLGDVPAGVAAAGVAPAGVAPAGDAAAGDSSSAGSRRPDGRSTREAIAAAFLALSRRVSAGDVLVVVLIGHGSGEGANSRVNVAGADPTAGDYAGWISGFARQTVVFVVAASASGDFVEVLRGPTHVVVTATRTAFERNESLFGGEFVKGLRTTEADADKDGRLTVMEAFAYAVREVARQYASTQRLLTEHAVVSDSVLAARTAFAAAATSEDPRVVALVAERRALEEELAVLRGRKATMPVEDYERELERLLVAIAERTQAIRAVGERP